MQDFEKGANFFEEEGQIFYGVIEGQIFVKEGWILRIVLSVAQRLQTATRRDGVGDHLPLE